MTDVVNTRECYQLIGACFDVYKDKGSGFLEAVFQECLELEFGIQSIPFQAQVPFPLSNKGRPLQQKYIEDFFCHGKIVVEIKAVEKLGDEHRSQLLDCLQATGHRLGLLINFGHQPKLEWERLVL